MAGIVLMGLAVWYLAKRTRQKRSVSVYGQGNMQQTEGPKEEYFKPPAELAAGQMASELRGNPVVPELPAYYERH